jgi:tetratricopeptide (TPR) repeat protein
MLITGLGLSYTAFAQQKKIDSLKSVIENNIGIKKFDPLVTLLRIYAGPDDNAALTLAYQARQVALEFGDTLQMVMSSRIIGQLCNRLSKVKEAESIISKTLPIAERNDLKEEYKKLLNNLAAVYFSQAKYGEALRVNFQVLDLREQDNNKDDMAASINNIGLIYFKLNNFNKALEYYYRALSLRMELRDNYFLDELYINIGLCHAYLEDYAESFKCFEKALQVCGEKCSDHVKLGVELGLGIAELRLGNYERAKAHCNESYILSKKIDNKRFQAENLSQLIRVFLIEGNHEAALNALTDCERISISSGYNEILLTTYRQFAMLFIASRDFEKASFYDNKFLTLKDSVYGEALIDSLTKIQTAFAERENLRTIQHKEEVIRRQNKLNIAMMVAAVLGTSLIIVLYRNNRLRKKINMVLIIKFMQGLLNLKRVEKSNTSYKLTEII